MKLTLNIADNRFNTFLEFINTLDYVSISKDDVPGWQKEIVIKRLQAIKSGKMKVRSWDTAKKYIFKK